MLEVFPLSLLQWSIFCSFQVDYVGLVKDAEMMVQRAIYEHRFYFFADFLCGDLVKWLSLFFIYFSILGLQVEVLFKPLIMYSFKNMLTLGKYWIIVNLPLGKSTVKFFWDIFTSRLCYVDPPLCRTIPISGTWGLIRVWLLDTRNMWKKLCKAHRSGTLDIPISDTDTLVWAT